MALGFLKVFQTGRGDFWAFEQRRRDRGLPVSLWDWFQHVLRHRSGRAMRHPRFFYFAVNTLLRNRAVRGKSYFVRRSIGHQAYEDFTPQAAPGEEQGTDATYPLCAMRRRCQAPQQRNSHNATTWRPCSSSWRQRARPTHAASCQACVVSCMMQLAAAQALAGASATTQLTTSEAMAVARAELGATAGCTTCEPSGR